MKLNRTDLAKLIDHTLLKPEATREDVLSTFLESVDLGCFSTCVSSSRISTLANVKEDSLICSVVGFPSGAVVSLAKAEEAKCSIELGANEIDMVADIGAIRDGDFLRVAEDISSVREAVPESVLLKVIIETAVLSDEQIKRSCEASEKSRANFVKTSTGFHPNGGASVHAVELMSQSVSLRL